MTKLLKFLRDSLNRVLKEESTLNTSIIGVSYHRSLKYLGMEIPMIITVESMSTLNGIKLYLCKVSYFQNESPHTHTYTEKELKEIIFFKTE